MTIYSDQCESVTRTIQINGRRELGDSLTMVVYSNMNTRRSPKLEHCVFTLPRHYGEKGYSSDRSDNASDFGMSSHRKLAFSNSLDDDDATSSSVNDADLEQEEEYVTLDRNYLFGFRTTPARHLSLVDIKRNRFDTDSRNCKNQTRVQNLSRNCSIEETREKSKTLSRKSLRRIAKNITSVITPRTTQGDEHKNALRTRSKSFGDLQQFRKDHVKKKDREKENEKEKDADSSSCYSDDDDGDDFGFLSYPFASSSAMHKAKSPSSTHRILPKIWKGKTKGSAVSSGATCLWTPEVSF